MNNLKLKIFLMNAIKYLNNKLNLKNKILMQRQIFKYLKPSHLTKIE